MIEMYKDKFLKDRKAIQDMVQIKFKDKKLICLEEIFVIFIISFFTFSYYIQIIKLSRRSKMLPTFIVIVLSGLIILSLLKNILIISRKPASIKETDFCQENKINSSYSEIKKLFLPIIFLLLFSISINYIGMYVAVPLFLLLSMLYYGIRKWGTLILISLGITLFIYLIFEKWLMVIFPKGIIF